MLLAGELLAIENFAYTARALSLPVVSSLGEFAAAARQFCSRPWPQTLQEHSAAGGDQRFLWRYCFGSAFAWTLLHQVLRISEGQRLTFTNALTRADGAELGLDWALGAAVLQLSNNSALEGAQLRQQQRQQRLLLSAAIVGTLVLVTSLAVVAVGSLRPGKHMHAFVWGSSGGGGSGSPVPAKQQPQQKQQQEGAGSWGSVIGPSTWADPGLKQPDYIHLSYPQSMRP